MILRKPFTSRTRKAFDTETRRMLAGPVLAAAEARGRPPRPALRRLAVAGAALIAVVPCAAHADPISAAILTAIGITATTTAVAVTTFILTTAATLSLSFLSNKLFGPKTGDIAARQASITQLSLGEGPREVIVGTAGSGGRYIDGGNFGGQYGTDSIIKVIKLADVQCDSLLAVWVGDKRYAFTEDGHLHADFNEKLEVYFRRGEIGDSPPDNVSNLGWGPTDKMSGLCYAVVVYTFDEEVMPSHPELVFEVKGALIYDPRKDDTVDGGDGAHRWGDPDTWEWSENAYLCRYQFARGFYSLRQVDDPNFLVVGRGLTALEAPPERVAAWANICDEAVALKAGGTEPRYRVGGILYANEAYRAVEEKFAAAMAGSIIQPEGGVEVEPGHAKASVRTITDGDLRVGRKIVSSDFVSDRETVNSVTARYIEPSLRWKDQAAPIRRVYADILAEGPHDEQLSLDLVTSVTQAQRCAEIRRRKARMEKAFGLPLNQQHSDLEDGDWVDYASARYLDGDTLTFRIEASNVGADYVNEVALAQIDATVFDWDEDDDELDQGAAALTPTDRPAEIEIAGFAVEAFKREGADGTITWHARAIYDTPVDSHVRRLRLEVRQVGGDDDRDTTTSDDVQRGVIVSGPLVADYAFEARLVPVVTRGRTKVATDWVAFGTGKARVRDMVGSGSGVAGDLVRLVASNAGKVAAWSRTTKSHGKLAFGIALNDFANGEDVAVQLGGRNDLASGLTPGAPVFAGATGTPTSTPPSTIGNTYLRIGKAESATEFEIGLGEHHWIKEAD